MPISLITLFSENGERNTDGLNQSNGFPAAQKPARQWFNFLFHMLTNKINEIAEQVNSTSISVSNMVDHIYPVGVIIEFADADFNPNNHFLNTTWVRYGEGKVSVGLSTQSNDPAWTKTIGNIFGEYTHQLTPNELPQIDLRSIKVQSWNWQYGDEKREDEGFIPNWDGENSMSGNDDAHNIVQPSIIVAKWQRTA